MSATFASVLHQPPTARRLGAVHALTLALVWLAFATSAVVFTEPAPYDALMFGLLVLLPLLGLTALTPLLTLYLILWLAIAAAGFVASTQAQLIDVGTKHSIVSLYLALSSALIAAFLTVNPERHGRLIFSGYTIAAVVAVLAALIGYFNLLPGAFELFTKFSRARGTFEDPNVYGPFIVPVLLLSVHGIIAGTAGRFMTSAGLFALLLFGLLLAFSRGAWINAGIAFVTYAYLTFVTAPTNLRRLKLILFLLLGLIVVGGIVAASMQIKAIGALYEQRSSLSLAYDLGPEGRFGGQLKALDIILQNPLGVGALEFGRFYHHEDAHNVYISMFLNAGWVGGIGYLGVVIATIAIGLRNALRPTATRRFAIIAVAAFIGLAGEGLVIDTDHWRHFYVLMAMVWGLGAAHRMAAPPMVHGVQAAAWRPAPLR